MDNAKEGILLIGTTMIVLVAFLITVLAVMIIYRKRRLDHLKEIDSMNERFSQELLQAQLEVQRETMHYIGREIHDNVGQKLVLAVLYIGQLDGELVAAQKIKAIAEIINESLGDLRSLSRHLTEPPYLHADLVQLLNNECTRVRLAGSCVIRLDSNAAEIPSSPPVRNFVLRILQEFLQNSLKHAHCTAITIRLNKETAGLEILAADNGKGFDIEMSEREGGGIGLKNMRKRAEIIGAEFDLTSAAERGTSMRLFIAANKLN